MKTDKKNERHLFLLFLFLMYSRDSEGLKSEFLVELIKQKEGRLVFFSKHFEAVLLQLVSIPTLLILRRKKHGSVEEATFYKVIRDLSMSDFRYFVKKLFTCKLHPNLAIGQTCDNEFAFNAKTFDPGYLRVQFLTYIKNNLD